jgi:hypothetical protein
VELFCVARTLASMRTNEATALFNAPSASSGGKSFRVVRESRTVAAHSVSIASHFASFLRRYASRSSFVLSRLTRKFSERPVR